MKRKLRYFFLIAITVAACERPRKGGDSAAVTQSPAAPIKSVARASVAWPITIRGIGPLEGGMTPQEAYAALSIGAPPTGADDWKGCGYVKLPGVPENIEVMVELGALSRFEVHDSSTITSEGARVGDTEARIKELYAGRVEVQLHKYTDGHYLIVRSRTAADSQYRFVFETDGAKVLQFRAGRLPQVEYVEGCA